MPDPAVPPDLLLDACSALRADLAARAGAPDAAALDAPPPTPNTEAVAAWLPLAVAFERAARLPARQRAAHFREARPAWDAAAEACGEPRYAALGARLARWRGLDPRLAVVKEVLWAFEQPEAAGYTRLALAGYAAVGRLLPADDVRQGYVLAQSARAVRTLGDVEAAAERYRTSERLGVAHRDGWLRVRSAIGLGATHHYLGNHPAARAVFRRVLVRGAPDARFTAAAHQGILLSAMAAHDWDEALSHGWHLLQARRSGAFAHADALILMAGLCRRIGRYLAATRAAERALHLSARPVQAITALQILVDVATATRDADMGRCYGSVLRGHVGGGAGPYEDARALLALGKFELALGQQQAANQDIAEARRIARAHHCHEIEFQCGSLEDALVARAEDHSGTLGLLLGQSGAELVQLTERSDRIVELVIAADGRRSALVSI